MTKHFVASALVAAIALCGAGAARAQAAGSTLVKLGWNRISPQVKSGDLTAPAFPGSQIDVRPASSLFFTVGYMLTDNISLEALGGLPYKHDITAAGSVDGVGRIGTIHQISPTLMLQYRFLPAESVFRPYVGAGPTWAKFYKSESSASLTGVTNPGGSPTTIGNNTAWGGSVEGGLTYKIDKHWFVDAAVIKTWIHTDTPLSTGQHISADLDPVSVNLSVGYAF